MNLGMKRNAALTTASAAGLTGWLLKRLLGRLGRNSSTGPRLALVERIALAPRQSLALVQAEGRRFLVATSAEGAPAFYALDERVRPDWPDQTARTRAAARVSW